MRKITTERKKLAMELKAKWVAQNLIAKAIGVSQATISLYVGEQGKRKKRVATKAPVTTLEDVLAKKGITLNYGDEWKVSSVTISMQ